MPVTNLNSPYNDIDPEEERRRQEQAAEAAARAEQNAERRRRLEENIARQQQSQRQTLEALEEDRAAKGRNRWRWSDAGYALLEGAAATRDAVAGTMRDAGEYIKSDIDRKLAAIGSKTAATRVAEREAQLAERAAQAERVADWAAEKEAWDRRRAEEGQNEESAPYEPRLAYEGDRRYANRSQEERFSRAIDGLAGKMDDLEERIGSHNADMAAYGVGGMSVNEIRQSLADRSFFTGDMARDMSTLEKVSDAMDKRLGAIGGKAGARLVKKGEAKATDISDSAFDQDYFSRKGFTAVVNNAFGGVDERLYFDTKEQRDKYVSRNPYAIAQEDAENETPEARAERLRRGADKEANDIYQNAAMQLEVARDYVGQSGFGSVFLMDVDDGGGKNAALLDDPEYGVGGISLNQLQKVISKNIGLKGPVTAKDLYRFDENGNIVVDANGNPVPGKVLIAAQYANAAFEKAMARKSTGHIMAEAWTDSCNQLFTSANDMFVKGFTMTNEEFVEFAENRAESYVERRRRLARYTDPEQQTFMRGAAQQVTMQAPLIVMGIATGMVGGAALGAAGLSGAALGAAQFGIGFASMWPSETASAVESMIANKGEFGDWSKSDAFTAGGINALLDQGAGPMKAVRRSTAATVKGVIKGGVRGGLVEAKGAIRQIVRKGVADQFVADATKSFGNNFVRKVLPGIAKDAAENVVITGICEDAVLRSYNMKQNGTFLYAGETVEDYIESIAQTGPPSR